jgi:hypothetical protein
MRMENQARALGSEFSAALFCELLCDQGRTRPKHSYPDNISIRSILPADMFGVIAARRQAHWQCRDQSLENPMSAMP